MEKFPSNYLKMHASIQPVYVYKLFDWSIAGFQITFNSGTAMQGCKNKNTHRDGHKM